LLIVAGLTLKNLQPRVWDPASPYYLPNLRAVMVSYFELHSRPNRRRRAMERGLRAYLGLPAHVAVYLDNGAFAFLSKGGEVPRDEYEAFVREARPGWYAVPQDYIPTPAMSADEQRRCFERTMVVNRAYRHDGFVPVVHIGPHLDEYFAQVREDDLLRTKPAVGLGGIVPNLLRAPKAAPYADVLDGVRRARQQLAGRQLHAFGIGGTATLHLAALLGLDSLDSSGWRNRAARGIVQLPGSGDRVVADLGSWRGRAPSRAEWLTLAGCPCPACRRAGIGGLRASGIDGFSNRATHNLWTLLHEAEQIEAHLAGGTYAGWYPRHLDNSVYRPLITQAARQHPSLAAPTPQSR
jgi:7-cyano-7-deazaguanine tRNA-ribosyltransferase